jgi:hypothetical protein
VTLGSSTTLAVNVAPTMQRFDGVVTLTCGELPPQTACSFSPAQVTPGAGLATTLMTISTTKTSATGSALTLGLVCIAAGLVSRRRSRQLVLVTIVAGVTLACGKGGMSSTTNQQNSTQTPPPNPGPIPGALTPGSYVIAVTGTAGTSRQSTTLTLTVQ